MTQEPSFLSLAAAGLYIFVVMACAAATGSASKTRQAPWHMWTWALLGVLFVILIAMRVTGTEEALRDASRAALRSEGTYEMRRETQSAVVAIIIMAGGVTAFYLFYRAVTGSLRRRDVTVKLAMAAGLGMVGLVALRMISLHAIDRLLYGALKLNWVIDVGAAIMIMAAAAYYTWLLRVRRGPAR